MSAATNRTPTTRMPTTTVTAVSAARRRLSWSMRQLIVQLGAVLAVTLGLVRARTVVRRAEAAGKGI